MPYETPTAAEFKARHPSFAAVDDAVVEDAIAEAETRVDETWREADRETAVMLYAAHVLTLNGHGRTTEGQVAALGLSGVQSVRSGGLSVTFSRDSGAVSGSALASTSYGRRFRDLLRLNFGGPRIVRGSTAEALSPVADDDPL